MKTLLARLRGEQTRKTPVWFMRQAGRYLPEYKELREKKEDFMAFCFDPVLASLATLQPIKRFDVDGAILFSDILVIPKALGQNVRFEKNTGPKLDPIDKKESLQTLKWDISTLYPVFETIKRVKESLPESITFLGFSGGPWTVACYMLGGGAKSFEKSVLCAKENPSFVDSLVDLIEKATIEYLLKQIENGVDAVQIFESHAGLLEEQGFDRWVVHPTKRIVKAIREHYPSVPVIGFPRGVPLSMYECFSVSTGVNALSLDCAINRKKAKERLYGKTLQGNLSPELLRQGGSAMDREGDEILKDWGKNHVFNLGHGILPETPIQNIERLISRIKT